MQPQILGDGGKFFNSPKKWREVEMAVSVIFYDQIFLCAIFLHKLYIKSFQEVFLMASVFTHC